MAGSGQPHQHHGATGLGWDQPTRESEQRDHLAQLKCSPSYGKRPLDLGLGKQLGHENQKVKVILNYQRPCLKTKQKKRAHLAVSTFHCVLLSSGFPGTPPCSRGLPTFSRSPPYMASDSLLQREVGPSSSRVWAVALAPLQGSSRGFLHPGGHNCLQTGPKLGSQGSHTLCIEPGLAQPLRN